MSATLSYLFIPSCQNNKAMAMMDLLPLHFYYSANFFLCFLMVCSRPEDPRPLHRPSVDEASLAGLWN
ncbi:hypothetical protein CORC01_07686 [Colletotrichum orchidophilum]|uniref:Uncharacterized protein n=1 Tax=Colletotrichum orchidophilum TaxID=1209926 RepID=A0A1G4B6P9_9PEZI|nr:uncharacterized protein CORC01_07686 [Colletotrichum orchidophilum]OHE97077.1 hypothetical protein CORC01_07686 [Colletotrichum orchidophilum]